MWEQKFCCRRQFPKNFMDIWSSSLYCKMMRRQEAYALGMFSFTVPAQCLHWPSPTSLYLCVILFRPVSSLILENIEGFVLNQLTEYHLGPFTLPYSRRHWVALRRLPTAPTSSEEYAYYNLDSKLALPLRIGSVSRPENSLSSRQWFNSHMHLMVTEVMCIM